MLISTVHISELMIVQAKHETICHHVLLSPEKKHFSYEHIYFLLGLYSLFPHLPKSP